MRATTLFVAILLLSACGAAPSPMTPAAGRAVAPEGMAALAKKSSPATCVAKSMEWGDKDGDGLLGKEEYVDLTLIALDATARFEREKIADLEKKKAKIAEMLADDPDNASLKAKLAECDARRKKAEQHLEKLAKDRVKHAKESEKKFAILDADRSGSLDRAELLNACRVASKE